MSIQSLRGFSDIVDSEQSSSWHYLRNICIQTALRYGYTEIHLPVLESSDLFIRSIGGNSDIVYKEMYTFEDKGQHKVSLRPEGTAGCVRACIEHNLLYDSPKKYFYIGPMFRRERPQKGRLRQFHQFGVEALGYHNSEVDIEQMQMIQDILSQLQITSCFEINYLASNETRTKHKLALQAYFGPHLTSLDELEQKRYHENPLRLLHSKSPILQSLYANAPVLSKFYTEDETSTFLNIQETLKKLNIPFKINSTLVRGLDYYSGLVYECQHQEIGSQSAICGGGRYDGLFEQLSSKSHPATGFSVGLERILPLVKSVTAQTSTNKVYWVNVGRSGDNTRQTLVDLKSIRSSIPDLQIHFDPREQKLKTALQRAHKLGYRFMVFPASQGNTYHLKNLSDGSQSTVNIDQFTQLFNSGVFHE